MTTSRMKAARLFVSSMSGRFEKGAQNKDISHLEKKLVISHTYPKMIAGILDAEAKEPCELLYFTGSGSIR